MKLPIKTIVATHIIASACYAEPIPEPPETTEIMTPASWFVGDLHYDKINAQAATDIVEAMGASNRLLVDVKLNLENLANHVITLSEAVNALAASNEPADTTSIQRSIEQLTFAMEDIAYLSVVTKTGLLQGPIDINTATYNQLIQVPGLGFLRATHIMSRRTPGLGGAPFTSIDDLANLPGFTPELVVQLSWWLRVGESE